MSSDRPGLNEDQVDGPNRPMEVQFSDHDSPREEEDIIDDSDDIGGGDDDDEDEDDDYYYYSYHDDDADRCDGVGRSGRGRSGLGAVGRDGSQEGSSSNNNDDPEFFVYDCLTPEEVEKWMKEIIQQVTQSTMLSVPEARQWLNRYNWSVPSVVEHWTNAKNAEQQIQQQQVLHQKQLSPSSSLSSSAAAAAPVPSTSSSTLSSTPASSASSLLLQTSLTSPTSATQQQTVAASPQIVHHSHLQHHQPASYRDHEEMCEVCAITIPGSEFSSLRCRHRFCSECWELHFEYQIAQGISTNLSCMSQNCDTLVPEDFIRQHVRKIEIMDRYVNAAFRDNVIQHPQLRFCPGVNCKIVMRSANPLAKRCTCTTCKTTFCYQCGNNYHAPTDCETIKRWLTKCADDSETANYMSAHTKDCPKCNICIEKNGGCNHMRCYSCKHDFCWMCLGDWKTHGSEYYGCSRYKENPNIANESVHAQAREALKKYLHYFERWENHSKSLKLEAQTLEKIKNRITDKVMNGSGTWIDWQYLLDASALLAKCRYTLQYTYPYAYYMKPSPRKELFEYQQAQLEAEIENLSWKIEHAETTDRGDLENQIDIAEKRRTTLLKDFLES